MNQSTTTEKQGSIEQRVLKAIATTFNVSPADIGRDTRMGSIPQWDSMGHMQLIVAIEQAFDVTIPNFAVADLVSVPDIVQAVTSLADVR